MEDILREDWGLKRKLTRNEWFYYPPCFAYNIVKRANEKDQKNQKNIQRKCLNCLV